MKNLNSKEVRNIAKRVTLKKVKLGFGHDRNGAFADFYLDGKSMGYFNDDGWGGESDIVYYSPIQQKTFEDFLTENNFTKIMFEYGWEFMEDVNKIDLHTQAEEIINIVINLKEIEKVEKKMVKLCEKGIYYRTSEENFSGIQFKLPIKEMIEKHGERGKEFIQKSYSDLKQRLKPNETIINTNLEPLGIKL